MKKSKSGEQGQLPQCISVHLYAWRLKKLTAMQLNWMPPKWEIRKIKSMQGSALEKVSRKGKSRKALRRQWKTRSPDY